MTFDPLALLLDASLEGELDLVKKTATEVSNPSAANDEGITALHNAICAGHLDIVQFLVLFGCDVNAQENISTNHFFLRVSIEGRMRVGKVKTKCCRPLILSELGMLFVYNVSKIF